MDAIAADVARRRRILDAQRCAGIEQRAGLELGSHIELIVKALPHRLEMPLGSDPVACEQKIADEVPAVHFAKRIGFNKTDCVRGSGRVVANGMLVVHHSLKRLDQPAPQDLSTKEGPLVELRAVTGRKAVEKVTGITAARQLELTLVASLFEQLRIHLQVDRCRPPNGRPVNGENLIAERELDAMQ